MKPWPKIALILAGLVALTLLAALLPGLLPGRAPALPPQPETVAEGLVYLQEGVVWWQPAEAAPRALNDEGYALEARLSPDRRTVAYLLVPDEALEQAPLPAQLWLFDLAAGQARPLAPEAALRSRLSWSPDGGRLGLVEAGALVVYDPLTGARTVLTERLSYDGVVAAGYGWLPNGGLVCLTQDADGRQSVRLAGLSGGHREIALPAGVRASAIAWSPLQGQATLLLPREGALYQLQLHDGALARLTPEGVNVAAFAWSPQGDQLAYADAERQLWLAQADETGLRAAQRLMRLEAHATELSWPAAESLLATLAVRGGTAAAAVAPVDGGLRTAGYDPALQGQSAPASKPALHEVGAPFDWYRFQGDTDSGPCASTNCGPTSVAMAIQFGRDDHYVPISEIRAYVSDGTCDGTNGTQLRAALTHWGISFERIVGMSAVRDAVVERGHIVIAPVIMGDIAPGADYEVWNADPAAIYGRYYSYALGHWLVVRGISHDGQWVEVYDPNVWYSGKYHYADGAPKGRDRLYPYGEFATALLHNSNWAIEITDVPTPALPEAPTDLTASAGAYTDRVELSWRAVEGASHYAVWRAELVDGPRQALGQPVEPLWQDATPDPGVTAYYWVAACHAGGCGEAAGPVEGYRAPVPVPEDVTASDYAYGDRVQIAWQTVAGANHYALYRSDGADGEPLLLAEPVAPPWDDLDATPGQAYWYSVRACNALGCSGHSQVDRGVCAYAPLPHQVLVPLALRGCPLPGE